MRRPTFRRPPAVGWEPDAPAPPQRGVTIARFALIGAAVGAGFLVGALSSGPASADIGHAPSVGADRPEPRGVLPRLSLDGLVDEAIALPQARRSDQDRRSDEAGRPDQVGRSDDARRPDRERGPSHRSSVAGRPDGGRGAEVGASRRGRPDSDRAGRVPVTVRPGRVPAADRSPGGPGGGRHTRVEPPVPSAVSVVGDASVALAGVATASPSPDLAEVATGLVAVPRTVTAIVRPSAAVRPVLSTIVTAVSSGTEAVTTPVARLVGVVAPVLPAAPGCLGGALPTVGGPVPPASSPGFPPGAAPEFPGAAPPGLAAPPDQPPSAVPPAALTPAAPVTGAVPGWHRTPTGQPVVGSRSTPGSPGFPRPPVPPGGDGVTTTDGHSGQLRGLALDAYRMPVTAAARADVSPSRGNPGRFPGVTARPG